MNLIEQLGGYEETKKHLDSCWCDDENRAYILKKLLEYRRQHNIFEVGDKVVFKPERSDDFDLYTIDRVLDGGSFLCVNDYRQAFKSISFRHATNEEIKAGKRLEVNQ